MKKTISFLIAAASLSCCAAQNNGTVLPNAINFERQVIQQTNGEEGKSTTTYYFTINGDYALAKHEAPGKEGTSAILYTKDGKMCMVNEKAKTITIMNMPKVIGEGAEMGKEIAEKLKKKPLKKDDEEKITVNKTGKTKMICGYTAYEYEIKNEGGTSSWWYTKVDFDPIKIYTMAAGSAGIAAKMKGREASLKNNPMAIPALNKNYLWAEAEAGGKKGLETKTISATTFSFSTAGYTIKDFGRKGLKDIIKENAGN